MSHWEASGKSSEWYTPKYIFDALGVRFDLDVAAPEGGPLHVPCSEWLWHDGLDAAWWGFVWCNMPFGGRNAIAPWLAKFCTHGHGIALTPDRTSAPWFQQWARRVDAILFMPKVKFIRPDGTEGRSPSSGTALWGAGRDAVQALRKAAPTLGLLTYPVKHLPDLSPEIGAVARPSSDERVATQHSLKDTP